MWSILRAYNSALLHRPLSTQILTSLALFGGGDIIAQQLLEKKKENHEWARTLRLASYGGFVFAPLATRWFKTLEFINFKNIMATRALKIGLDQFVAAPTMLAVFFTSMNYLEGNDLEQAEERLREKWGPTLYQGWMIFIPLQTINFTLVPPHLRLLLLNGTSLFWNGYLSYANASRVPVSGKIAEHAEKLLGESRHKLV
ncbi:integral membrane protein [Melampsora americana]|nr:integral membrane protein [Melampsora americana]